MNSDLLNPMVVKELRQGLKSRGFLIAYLGLHGLMVFSFLSLALSDWDEELPDLFFWGLVMVVLLVLLPGRACFGVAEEMRSRTLEPVLLTRLTPGRIVRGKWCAHALQALMIFSTLLPYVVARYFVGQQDVVSDLGLLLLLLLGCMSLAGMALGLSCVPGTWTRNLLLWPLVLLFGFLGLIVLDEGLQARDLLQPAVFHTLWPMFSALGLFGVGFGTAWLGQPSAGLKRLTLLAMTLLLVAVGRRWVNEGHYLKLILLPATLFFLDALSERLPWEEGRGKPRQGLRYGLRLLSPGWPSALPWLLMFVLLLWAADTTFPRGNSPLLMYLSYHNALLLPLLLLLWIPHKPANRLLLLVLMFSALLVAGILLMILNDINRDFRLTAQIWPWVPLVGFFHWADGGTPDDAEQFKGIAVTFLLLAALQGTAWRQGRKGRV